MQKQLSSKLTRQLLALGILGLTTLPATAATISVNFHSDDVSSLADHELTGTEVAGLVPIDGWNNISIGTAGAHNTAGTIFTTTTATAAGTDTDTAVVASSTSSTWFVGYAASSAAAAAEIGLAGNHDDLFNSYLALNGPDGDGTPADAAVISVSGLSPFFTSNGYQLIIYSDTDKGPVNSDRVSAFTITPTGGSAITAFTEDDGLPLTGAQATFDGTYVLSDGDVSGDNYSNYTVIENLTADSFTIGVSALDGVGGRGGISGFQIIAVPEPSAALLLGLVGGIFLSRRKR